MTDQADRDAAGGSSAERPRVRSHARVAEEMSSLARLLETKDDTDTMLDEVVAAAVRLVPGTQDGSISMVTGRSRVTSRHASSVLPEVVDEIQSETGQGPCLDAVFDQQTVRVDDMSTEQRWPRFARRAHAAGARSMLSLQLYVEGDNLGALNLYSREADAFDDESEEVGLLFASHAAVAFSGAQKVDNLHRAVWTRDLIGQAKGMLMLRYDLDSQGAFRLLVQVSQHSGRKLHDVAEELVTTRKFDAFEQPVE